MRIQILSLLSLLIMFSFNSQAQTEKPKVPKEYANMKSIDPLATKFEIKVGESVISSMPVHGSIGLDAKATIKDESIVKNAGDQLIFNRAQAEDEVGGDDALRYFVFKGLKAGKTKIVFEEMYRGDIKKKQEVEITVK